MKVYLDSEAVVLITEPRIFEELQLIQGCNTVIEEGVQLSPITSLRGCNLVKTGSSIQNSRLDESSIGAKCLIRNSEIKKTKLGTYNKIIGAYIEDCQTDDRVSIGPGAEIKRAVLESGVKAPHLCHLADCAIGEDSNIAFGVCFCNFDGIAKNKISIGKRCFIGAGVYLIGPCTIEDEVFISAKLTLPAKIHIPSHALVTGSDRNFQIKKNSSFCLGKDIWVTTASPTEKNLIEEIMEELNIYELGLKLMNRKDIRTYRDWLISPNSKINNCPPIDLLRETVTYKNSTGAASLKELIDDEVQSLSI